MSMLMQWDDLHQDATRMLAPLSAYQTPCHRVGSGMDWLLAERHMKLHVGGGGTDCGDEETLEGPSNNRHRNDRHHGYIGGRDGHTSAPAPQPYRNVAALE